MSKKEALKTKPNKSACSGSISRSSSCRTVRVYLSTVSTYYLSCLVVVRWEESDWDPSQRRLTNVPNVYKRSAHKRQTSLDAASCCAVIEHTE